MDARERHRIAMDAIDDSVLELIKSAVLSEFRGKWSFDYLSLMDKGAGSPEEEAPIGNESLSCRRSGCEHWRDECGCDGCELHSEILDYGCEMTVCDDYSPI